MAGGNIPVCIEKSAPLWIIIPSVQIIETRYGVIIVTTVTERVLVQCRQRLCCQVVCCYLSPCVIYVFYHISLYLFFVPGEENGLRNSFRRLFSLPLVHNKLYYISFTHFVYSKNKRNFISDKWVFTRCYTFVVKKFY